MPSVVLSARTADGRDVTNVKVSVDGQLLVARLEGKAIEINPGVHAFVFEADDFPAVEQKLVIKTGDSRGMSTRDIPLDGYDTLRALSATIWTIGVSITGGAARRAPKRMALASTLAHGCEASGSFGTVGNYEFGLSKGSAR
jgi:hypothetical protein